MPHRVSPFSIDEETEQTADTALESRLASHAQAGATALATGNAAKSGERLVRSAVSNEFNSSAQDWLSRFGTAQVQLNVDDNFKLDGSAVDVLVPLYDNQKSLLLSQLGARNKDSRNTVNIGVGVRTFHESWMVGANTFFDNDITGKNRRVGIGAEAWTNYLKLSANTYLGTTRWHQSRDVAGYNERPANGYDLRADAYLPAHPQLGGKLMYEKYRGDEVALFGKDNRQKNPHSVTAGINYTPVPLLTVGTEHRAGKGGQSDSSINFQLNYRLGESWQSHLNTSAVAGTRTLAGSRYDLVERNNNIVLDYQKQELMRLTLPHQIAGEAGSTATVSAQVTSRYGLERIDWDSAHLVAGGGQFSQSSANTVSITLPAYQASTAPGGNRYTLSAVAYDTQGNRSNPSTIVIIVEPQRVSVANTQSKITPEILIADGRMTGLVVITLRDDRHQPVVGVAKELVLSSSFVAEGELPSARSTASSDIQLSGITETTAGVYSATLTAGTQPGVVTITPSINALTLNPVKATLITNGVSIAVDSLNADRSTAIADGNSQIALTATLKDGDGNLLSDAEVAFVATGGILSNSQVRTDSLGQAVVTIKSTQAGSVTITARSVADSRDVGKTRTLAFIANQGNVMVDSLTADSTTAFVDGNNRITFTATVKDASGHAKPDTGVTFSTTGGTLSDTTVQTDGNGQAVVMLTSTEEGSVTVIARSTTNAADTGQSVSVKYVYTDLVIPIW